MNILDDVKELAGKLHDDWWKRYRALKTEDIAWPLDFAAQNVTTDANGICTLHLYKNTTDRNCLIHRITVNADGKTPATIVSAGYAYVFIGNTFGGRFLECFPQTLDNQVLPLSWTESGDSRFLVKPSQILAMYFNLTSANAGLNISGGVWGTFYSASKLYNAVY